MRVRKLAVPACLVALMVGVQTGATEGAPIVLNCKITEGIPIDILPSVTIMIDEDKSIVVYSGRPLLAQIPDFDASLKITRSNEKMVEANNEHSILALTKHDGRFVYSFAFAALLPGGDYVAAGATQRGICIIKSPFR